MMRARGPRSGRRRRATEWRAPSDELQSPVVLIIIATVFGLIGAGVGWWKDTRVLYRRPGSKWTTDLVPKEKIRSAVLARRRRKRLMTTVEFGVYGAIFGAALFWGLQRFVK
jgi:hypothetical protein